MRLMMICAGLALALFACPAMAADDMAQTVPVEPHNGAFVVPALLNGILPAKFIVDSGAADVSIPVDVASALKSAGAMTSADFLGTRNYMMADGSLVPSEIYRLATLKIGGVIMHDVTVRVSAAKSDLLLGQSFLSRLKSWSMDNARRVMVLN